MSLVDTMAAVLWLGVTLYTVFGGADFGGGLWDLLAGDAQRGARQRALIESSIGPIWEANHVWLIFALVIFWTGFPAAFTSVMTAMWIPLTFAAFGIILRGAGFVFRKAAPTVTSRRLFGATFALSSVITPFFLGAVAGGVASGRIATATATLDPLRCWINPTSVAAGVMAVTTCAQLAAVYLTADADRQRKSDLSEVFRRRALLGSGVVAIVDAAGLFVVHADAPSLGASLLEHPSLVCAAYGLTILGFVALWRRSYLMARPLVAGSVAVITAAWGIGQYPELVPGSFTLAQAAAPDPVLRALLVSLGVGALLFVPSLVLLLRIFQTRQAR